MWRSVILNFLRWAIPRPAGSCPNLHNVLALRVFPISSSRGSTCTSTRGTCGDASNTWFFTRNRLAPASVTSLNRRQLKPVDPSPDKRIYRKLTHYRHEPEADQLTNRFIAEAIARVIVDHSDGLHEGVTDGGTYEAEAAGFQVLTQRIRFRGACRKLARPRPIVL